VIDLSEDDPGLDVLHVRAKASREGNEREKKRVAFDMVTSTPKTKSGTGTGKKTAHQVDEDRTAGARNANQIARLGSGRARGIEVEMSRVSAPGPVDALERDLNSIETFVENATQHQKNVEDEHKRTVATLLRELQRMEQENEALRKEYDERTEEGNDQWNAMLERRLREYESNIRQTSGELNLALNTIRELESQRKVLEGRAEREEAIRKEIERERLRQERMLQEEYERAEQERERRKELEEETRRQKEMLQRAIEKARQEEVKRREAEEEVERQERLVQHEQNRVMQFEEDFDRCLRDAVN
jgi:chromosome segregation ATPase